VILAANPGLHIESLQPIVRVILLDALERWAASLESAAPVFTLETAYELADRIVNPRPPKKEEQSEADTKPPVGAKEETGASRADAVPRAAGEAKPFDPTELEFAFEEGGNLEVPPGLVEPNPAIHIPAKAKKRILGMTPSQLALLGGMALIEVCLLAGLALIILLNP
jgi:hypothetical protein